MEDDRNRKSAAVVAIAAMCLIAFSVPMVFLANNDDDNSAVYFLDFNLDKVKSEDMNVVKNQVCQFITMDLRITPEQSGNHIGSDDASIKTITNDMEAYIAQLIWIIHYQGATDVKIKCLQGDLPKGALAKDYHHFVFYY